MRHSVVGRKAFQLYAVLMLGLFLYLHYYRYGAGRAIVLHREQGTPGSSGPPNLLSDQAPQQPEGVPQQPAGRSRFIMGLNYWEQFTMATANLLSLVCLGNSWNATIVQPFTFNSRLYGLPNFKPDDNFRSNKSAHPLDLIYDLNSLNKLLLRQQLPKLGHYNSFLQTAKRELIVAHYLSPKETHELTVMKGEVKTKVERGFKQGSIIDCKDHLSDYRIMIENAFNHELSTSRLSLSSQKQFRVDKYWCINMTDFSTPHESAEKMQLGVSGDMSLIIVNWRGIGKRHVVKNSAKGIHLNNRIAMLNACKQHLGISWRNLISYSPPVVQVARQFATSLGLSPTDAFAAIHIRSEKLGLREPRLPGVTEACFAELMRLKDSLVRERPSLKMIYITDYAPYSSDTCKNCRGARDIKIYLHQRNIYNTYFDPVRFNVTLDSGFAAAVESQFLASANFLFLCGGGGYQNQIGTRFLDLKRKMTTDFGHKNIFRVCNDDEDISRLLRLDSSNHLTPPGT